MNKIAASVFIAILSTACEKTVIKRGYIVESVDFTKIVAGKDNMESVYNVFGSPTFRSSQSNETGETRWYYVSKRTEKNSFLDPTVLDKKNIVITFGDDEVVRSVKESSYESPVPIVSKTTKSDGKTKGVMGETFGGLGKYLKRYTDKK